MSSDTNRLTLPDAIELDFQVGTGRGYPPLDRQTANILKEVAEGLCLSFISVAWAWYEARQGNGEGWATAPRPDALRAS